MVRRLAAIMFTDVAGYTAMTQADEAGALKRLRQQEKIIRPILDTYHGRKVKSMGDGLLIEFPNALAAVECAVEFQRQLHEHDSDTGAEPLRIRVGIHLGDIERRGTDILGDAVNIASRIEPIAEPGGICVSAQVFDQTHNKVAFQFEKVGMQNLKGVREAMAVYRVALPWMSPPVPEGSLPKRLAVLPLSNLSPDPNDEYFADGLTEEIISTVSKVPNLGVISRTSVMQYKSQTKSIGQIGRELSAGSILEGSVRKAGDRVRVTVQLIDAASDQHLWSESYDRSLDNVFSIQSEIAQQVATALEIQLLDSLKGRLAQPPTEVTRAHLLFMKGVYHLQLFSKKELEVALDFFQRATREDPRYARAYARIAAVYSNLGAFEMVPSPLANSNAERAAKTALEIDESLAEPHITLAQLDLLRGDWNRALRGTVRAVELDPNLSMAHAALAFIYILCGLPEKAFSAARRATELDPLSVFTLHNAATTYIIGDRPDLALPYAQRALALSPESSFVRAVLGLCYVRLSSVDRGIDEIQTAVKLSGRENPAYLALLVYALSRANRVAETEKIISELLSEHERQGTGAFALASSYAAVRDSDRAFEWLEKAVREESGVAALFRFDFGFRDLSTDPRFQKFLEKIGLPFRGSVEQTG